MSNNLVQFVIVVHGLEEARSQYGTGGADLFKRDVFVDSDRVKPVVGKALPTPHIHR